MAKQYAGQRRLGWFANNTKLRISIFLCVKRNRLANPKVLIFRGRWKTRIDYVNRPAKSIDETSNEFIHMFIAERVSNHYQPVGTGNFQSECDV